MADTPLLLSQPTATTATASDVTITYDSSPVNWMYVHTETRAEGFHRRSNECADVALSWGLVGKAITAQAFAELADVYDVLANHQAALEAL